MRRLTALVVLVLGARIGLPAAWAAADAGVSAAPADAAPAAPLPPAATAGSGSAADYEAAMDRELEQLAPDLLVYWREGNALRATEPAKAEMLYAKVIVGEPGFSHARRRRCAALNALERHAEALPLCEAAMAQADTPENRASLALALVAGKFGEAQALRAHTLIESALGARPDDVDFLLMCAQIELTRKDQAAFARCAERALVLAPARVEALVLGTLSALGRGDTAEARRRLARARAAGYAADAAAELEARIVAIEGPPETRSLARSLLIVVPLLLAIIGFTVWRVRRKKREQPTR